MKKEEFMMLPKEEAIKEIKKSIDKFIAWGWIRVAGTNERGETLYEPTEKFPWFLCKR